MKFTWYKTVVYIIGLGLLGLCVSLIQLTNLGMSSWDAMYRNLYVGIPLEYKYLNPIIALILIPIGYGIQKKKWSLWMLFPLFISFFIGFVIDSLLLIIPSVAHLGLFWNLLYLSLSLIVCAIGLNFIVYCKYPLPALDEVCYGIGVITKKTYGFGKLVGELIALLLAILFGLYFQHQAVWFFIGPTTIIFSIAIGPLIQLFEKPLQKGLHHYEYHRRVRRRIEKV